jgi:hypothetical protein
MKKGKKFIALFLVFSLLIINCATLSRLEEKREKRKKHGANLIIQKINGQQVRGELITVKPSSLLLLNTEGKDVSVDIEEIKVITVVKKSQALLGVGTGLFVGAGSGAAIGASLWVLGLPVMAIFGEAGIESWKDDFPGLLWGGVLIGAGIGLLLGVSSGAASGIDKTIQIEGMSDSEIQETLEKLRKKARIRDYK